MLAQSHAIHGIQFTDTHLAEHGACPLLSTADLRLVESILLHGTAHALLINSYMSLRPCEFTLATHAARYAQPLLAHGWSLLARGL
jgi:hypothetical protein